MTIYRVGLLNDKSKAYEITHWAWPCYVMKYCFMQTHECRLKLDAAGSHLSIVRVAIYIVYLRHEIFNMQHKESIPEHLMPWKRSFGINWNSILNKIS
jgi:hypothetical protein